MKEVIVECSEMVGSDGSLWLKVEVDRRPYQLLGPFATSEERSRAHEDFQQTIRDAGGFDLPLKPQ